MFIAVLALGYGGLCAFYPLLPCGKCDGKGKFSNPWGGKGVRRCPRCGGSGKRTRLARRVWDMFVREEEGS